MAGLRDVLIHDYMGISLKIVWNVVKSELPQLKTKIIELLDKALDFFCSFQRLQEVFRNSKKERLVVYDSCRTSGD